MRRQWLIVLFVFGLLVWLRWGKILLSHLANFFRHRLPWQPLTFASLEAYGQWLPTAVCWKMEPLHGFLDTFPSLEHIAWQLKTSGRFADDCDGLAYFSAHNVLPFCDDPNDCYVASVVLNPFAVGWLYTAHALCIFRSGGHWRVISNDYLYPQRWNSFEEALQENDYCLGWPMLYAEIRDAKLHYQRAWRPPAGQPTQVSQRGEVMTPTEQLKEEHQAIKLMLSILEGMSQRLDAGQAVSTEHLEQSLEFIRLFADKCHHGKEEDVLFPAMEAAGIPKGGGPIGVMLLEHEAGRGYVRGLAEAVARYKAGDRQAAAAITTNARNYVALLNQHIFKEDNILYPMADMRLSPARQARMLEEFEAIERERLGSGKHEELHRMLEHLQGVYL